MPVRRGYIKNALSIRILFVICSNVCRVWCLLAVIGGLLGCIGYLYERNMAEIRNEQVLSRAMIISKELQIGAMNKGVRKREDMSRSRVEIRDASKLMIAENWHDAREKFENAASLSTVYRDARTAAMARVRGSSVVDGVLWPAAT